MMAVRQQFGRGVAWMAFGNWTEQAVNFIVFVTLARILDADAFGLLAMASVVIVLAEFLVRETLTETLIAADAPGARDYNAVFWALVVLGAALGLLIWALAGPIARLYGHPEIRPLVVAMSPTILMIAVTAVPVAVLRRDLAFRSLALRAIAGVVAGGITGIGMALAGWGVWALIGQRVVQVAVNVAVAWIAVPWRPGAVAPAADLRRAAGFGGQVMALRASELAITQVPTVILGAALGPTATGFYSVAWRLIETASFLIVTPLRMAAQPAFAALRREGAGQAAHLLADISRLSGYLAFPAFAGIAALAGPILALLFGPGWGEAALPLAILSAAGAYFCIEKVQLAFALAMGRAAGIALLGWLTVALCLAACGMAVARGPWAVAAGFVAVLLAVWPLRFAVLARLSGMPARVLAAPQLRPALAAAVMALAVWGAVRLLPGAGPALRLAVGVPLGICTYAALTVIFMPDRLRLLRSFLAGPPGPG